MRLIKRYRKLFIISAVMAAVAVMVSESLVHASARASIYSRDELDKVPHCKTALVLGCRPGNWYYRSRMKAAADLYNCGKVEYLLVSGDNSRVNYNESLNMAKDLEKLGVPAEKIYRDYAGFRTLDSVVRAHEIFCQDKVIIVSQKFHNERAIYLAKNSGVDAIGYCARHPGLGMIGNAKMFVRERLARIKAVLDVVVGVQPHFMGKKIEIGNVVQNPLPEDIQGEAE